MKKLFLILSLFLCLVIIKYIVIPVHQQHQQFDQIIASVEHWPVHNDSRLGLSFHYPPNWQVKQVSERNESLEDYYSLLVFNIVNPNDYILIESTNDKDFKEIQIDEVIQACNGGKKVNINGLNFILVTENLPSDYYFYLEGKIPIKFFLLNITDVDPFNFSEKRDKVLHQIIHTIKLDK